MVPQLFLFGLTPYLVRQLGLEAFGVWTFCLTLVALVSAFDGGLSGTFLRFVAVYSARSDQAMVPRLMTVGLLSALACGGLLFVLIDTMAARLALILNIPANLQTEAQGAIQIAGAVVAFGLVSNIFVGYLRGRAAYGLVSAGAIAGVIAFATYLVTTTEDRTDVRTYVRGLAIQAIVAMTVWAMTAVGYGARFARTPLPRSDLRSLLRFALNSQIASIAGLLTLQSDGLVIAAVLPIEALGIYGVAATASLAFRAVPFFALLPIRTQLSSVYGSGRLSAANRELSTLEVRWHRVVRLYACVATPAAVVAAYVIAEFEVQAAIMTGVLIVGYTFNLRAGVRIMYAAAVGRPAIEARAGLISVTANVVLTLLLVFSVGLLGVVAATCAASILGTLYVLRRTPFVEVRCAAGA